MDLLLSFLQAHPPTSREGGSQRQLNKQGKGGGASTQLVRIARGKTGSTGGDDDTVLRRFTCILPFDRIWAWPSRARYVSSRPPPFLCHSPEG